MAAHRAHLLLSILLSPGVNPATQRHRRTTIPQPTHRAIPLAMFLAPLSSTRNTIPVANLVMLNLLV
jgi:hypothetical protein